LVIVAATLVAVRECSATKVAATNHYKLKINDHGSIHQRLFTGFHPRHNLVFHRSIETQERCGKYCVGIGFHCDYIKKGRVRFSPVLNETFGVLFNYHFP
jgi:hypothetical protein